jgi:hypothetical protein
VIAVRVVGVLDPVADQELLLGGHRVPGHPQQPAAVDGRLHQAVAVAGA